MRVLAAGSLVLLLVLGACERRAPEQRDVTPELSAAAIAARSAGMPFPLSAAEERGRIVYESVCWTCHGSGGHGDGPAVRSGSVEPPPDFSGGEYASLTVAQLDSRFPQSGADPDHPHMQYVRTMFRPDVFSDALSYVVTLGWPAELPGSAIAGGQTYAFRCRACHGAEGRGDGEAAGLSPVPPADFTADSLIAARDWEGVYARIRDGGITHGSTMPPWGIVFSEPEIWNLVAYVASFRPEVLSPPPGRGGGG